MNDYNNIEQKEIEDIRWFFDPKKSSKQNILDFLNAINEEDHEEHHSADMALLALINDPDITNAYLKIARHYDK
jgi:hypothetical protein